MKKTSMVGSLTSMVIYSEFYKKVLAVTSDPKGCWPRAPAICDDPHAPLIITGLGQFSAALVGEVNKTLVRGVHCPGPNRQSDSVRGAEHTCLGFRTKLSRL
jgi:hypothetical protein